MAEPTPEETSDRFRALARRLRQRVGSCIAATSDEIRAAEEALGARFPTSYGWFQLEFGDCPVGPVAVFTVKAVEPPWRSIVVINLDERRDAHLPLPSRLIAFHNSGGGDLCCFDTSALENGECPVVWWDHEGGPDQTPEPAAPSFLDWLEGELREAEEDAGFGVLESLRHIHRRWLGDWRSGGR